VFYILERIINVIYTFEDASKKISDLLNKLELDFEYLQKEDILEDNRHKVKPGLYNQDLKVML
jgi:hypothetical protein